jgi:hypothetical protein
MGKMDRYTKVALLTWQILTLATLALTLALAMRM